MRIKSLVLPALLSALISLAGAANAGQYSFDYKAGGYDVSGLFTTSNVLNSVNGYDITGITGTLTGTGGGTINSLINNPNGANPTTDYTLGFVYDNVLFPNKTTSLDIDGVLFTTKSGNTTSTWNLWGTATGGYELYSYTANNGGIADVVASASSLTVTAVSEPDTNSLLLGGLALVGFVGRRRNKNFNVD